MIHRFEQFTSVISDIHRSIQRIEREEMERFGLKGAYAQYLLVMDRHPEGITAAALCESCDRDKAAVSRILADMEHRGLILKGGTTPYRALIRLTEEGRRVTKHVRARASAAVEAARLGLSDTDSHALYAILSRISGNLRAICKDGLAQAEKI